MSIKVQCECGQRFAVRGDIVGKTMKCSMCGAGLEISDTISEEGAVATTLGQSSTAQSPEGSGSTESEAPRQSGDDPDRQKRFRATLESALKASNAQFDFSMLIAQIQIPRPTAVEIAESLFTEFALRLANDGVLSDIGRAELDRWAKLLEISTSRQRELFKDDRSVVLHKVVSEVDGTIVDDKRDENRQLRHAQEPRGEPQKPFWQTKKPSASTEQTADSRVVKFVYVVPILLGTLILAWWGLPFVKNGLFAVVDSVNSMRGPEFFTLHFAVFVVMAIIVSIVRWKVASLYFASSNSVYIVTGVAFMIFEGLGAQRVAYGLNHGMHRFTFLIFGLIVGGAVLSFLGENEIESRDWSGTRVIDWCVVLSSLVGIGCSSAVAGLIDLRSFLSASLNWVQMIWMVMAAGIAALLAAHYKSVESGRHGGGDYGGGGGGDGGGGGGCGGCGG